MSQVLTNDGDSLSAKTTSLLLSARTLAKRLNLSVRTLWRLRSSGKLPESDSGEDINRALQAARIVCGDNGHAWRMLRMVAAWTDEAMMHPRLWAVAVALGEELTIVKRRMSGSRVCQIMSKAWGETCGLPYREMGRQWRKRLEFDTRKLMVNDRGS